MCHTYVIIRLRSSGGLEFGSILQIIIVAEIEPQASYSHFSHPSAVHGARISGLEARMTIVEDKMCDLDARGSEEADNLANERELDRFIITGDLITPFTCKHGLICLFIA